MLQHNRRYLSFFSGALGLDLGLEKAGLEVVAYNEKDKNCCKTIRLNRPNTPLYECDIRELSAAKLLKENNLQIGELFAIVGGPPCQAFSTAGRRNSLNDERGNVFLHFIDLISALKPKYLVIENVRGILSAPLSHRPHNQRGPHSPPLNKDELPGGALAFIMQKLHLAGYTPSFTLYNTAHFGVPQIRERVVILAGLKKKEIPYLLPTHPERSSWISLQDTIGVLKNSRTHEHINFPEKRLKFFRFLKSGENWRNLPEHLKKEAMGKSIASGGGRTGFYRRLDWNAPSPTLVTSPTMPATDLCHPEFERPLSVEEYAAIQTFPEKYQFHGKTLDKYKQIGNAVPCTFGKIIGEHLLQFEEGSLEKKFIPGKLSRYLNTDHKSWMASLQL
ncbi:MAG: DNA cytosine methyltransferase [Oligoflexia bacterium]|nr:DNA cytosine methyltransferase [Oligoflexia bacterium]MBF0367676.1 DNA cytosine methyltransferase [Oligoflexia bacterium]